MNQRGIPPPELETQEILSLLADMLSTSPIDTSLNRMVLGAEFEEHVSLIVVGLGDKWVWVWTCNYSWRLKNEIEFHSLKNPSRLILTPVACGVSTRR